jgi:hypothetical protein
MRARSFCCCAAATTAATWPGGPEITVDEGLLTAAIVTPAACSSSRPACSSPTRSDAIAPWPDKRRNARLRTATTRAASAMDSAPATHAAAISPWLCPITAAGRTP